MDCKLVNWKRWLGIFLILVGLFLNFGAGITGAVIGVGSGSVRVFGIISLVVGLGLVFMGREAESDLEYSIKEAIKVGVPLSEAKRIKKEADEKVKSGEWIELSKETVTTTDNPEEFPEGTSLCRYWGPREYSNSSKSRIKNLYKDGEVGKTHEVPRGSDEYKFYEYKKEGGKYVKKIIPKESGRRKASIPPVGSRVLHRHWEIGKMYDYQKNPRSKSSKHSDV